MSTRSQSPERIQTTRKRRSILEAVRKRRDEGPRWMLFAVVAVTIVVLAAMIVLLMEDPPTMEGFTGAAAVLAAFILPITLLAHFGGQIVGRYASGRPPSLRNLILGGVWMVSGAVGSAVGVALLQILHRPRLGPFVVDSIVGEGGDVLSLLFVNGLLAVGVGISVLFVRTAGRKIQRSATLLSQEDLLTAEFRAAQSVQRSLLPDEDARIYGFDISGTTAPAVEIGGDYYDYLSFADGTKGILVADAAGKGIPAALVMAKFQGMAQALSIHVADAREFFVGLNDTLRVRLDRRNFITVAMLTIDFDDRCTYYRAGHNPLFLYRAATGTVEELKPTGMALGLTHGAALRSSLDPLHFRMEKGDVALMYSDGLTEAVDAAGSPYEESRTAASLRAAAGRGLKASVIRAKLLSDLAAFVGDAAPHDDVTLVVVVKE